MILKHVRKNSKNNRLEMAVSYEDVEKYSYEKLYDKNIIVLVMSNSKKEQEEYVITLDMELYKDVVYILNNEGKTIDTFI